MGKTLKNQLPLIANLISAAIFGFAMLFIRSGMEVVHNDTIKFLAFRFATGFIVMTLLLLFKVQKVNYKGKPIKWILLCGLANPLLSQITETTSTAYAPTSMISVFNSLLPIVIVLLSIVINREYPTKTQTIFMLVSVAGVFLINFVDGQMSGATPLGYVLIICTLLFVGINRVLVRRCSAYFSSFEIIYLTTGMGAFMFWLETLTMHGISGDLGSFFVGLNNPNFVISVLYMGIGSCVIAFLFMTYASANLPIAVSSSTANFNTVIAILVGVFILHEQFRVIDVVGTALILLGVCGMSRCYNSNEPNINKYHIPKNSESGNKKIRLS